MFMKKVGGRKTHVQKEDKKTKGSQLEKMVHSHVLGKSMMRTQEVNGFKGSLTREVDERCMLKKKTKG
jgi:hypothetical protein